MKSRESKREGWLSLSLSLQFGLDQKMRALDFFFIFIVWTHDPRRATRHTSSVPFSLLNNLFSGFSSIYLKWKFFKYLTFFGFFSKNIIFGVHSMPVASNFVKIRLSQNSTKFDWVTRFRETNSMVKSVSSSKI